MRDGVRSVIYRRETFLYRNICDKQLISRRWIIFDAELISQTSKFYRWKNVDQIHTVVLLETI